MRPPLHALFCAPAKPARTTCSVDDLQSIEDLELYVDRTSVMLLFLSRGYFFSRNAMREVYACQQKQKPLILVHERSRSKGGGPLAEMIKECADEIRDFIFADRRVIPWVRVSHFQITSLEQIAEIMLLHTPRYRKDRELSRAMSLFVPGELTRYEWHFDGRAGGSVIKRMKSAKRLKNSKGCVLYASPHNPGAAAMAYALCSSEKVRHLKYCVDAPQALHHKQASSNTIDGSIKVTGLAHIFRAGGSSISKAPSPKLHERARPILASVPWTEPIHKKWTLPPPHSAANAENPDDTTHLVILLNADTWLGAAGDALAKQARLALRSDQISLLLVHEMDDDCGAVEFDRFFHVTPEDLVKAGIYKGLATPWFSGAHRVVRMNALV